MRITVRSPYSGSIQGSSEIWISSPGLKGTFICWLDQAMSPMRPITSGSATRSQKLGLRRVGHATTGSPHLCSMTASPIAVARFEV